MYVNRSFPQQEPNSILASNYQLHNNVVDDYEKRFITADQTYLNKLKQKDEGNF